MHAAWVLGIGGLFVVATLGGLAVPGLVRSAVVDAHEDDARASVLASVDGFVLLPSTDAAGFRPHRCAPQGTLGFVIDPVTPGAAFAVVATDAAASQQDLDIVFLRRDASCTAGDDLVERPHSISFGNEAGWVPADAGIAIVYLFQGAAAEFRYTEFAVELPPMVELDVDNAMHFRSVRVTDATSTYSDMYEPHIVVPLPGTIYVAGHTASINTHHSPVFVSRDDGAHWDVLPDPEPLPPASTLLPGLGGRIGQGNEGGIAADDQGRAWLYDAAYGGAGISPLYSWCDDGRRSCAFQPLAFDHAQLLTRACPGETPHLIDKPWARYGHGDVLLANVGLLSGFVEEFTAASMLGIHDPGTGTNEWNTCVAVGGMPGVPDIRDEDGLIAVPHVLRSADGEGELVVHAGSDVDALTARHTGLQVMKSWQPCQLFNGYSSFSAAGSHYVFEALGETMAAVVVSTDDLATFVAVAFDAGDRLRYMWVEGSKTGEGALLTWGVSGECGEYEPVTFYAAHVTLAPHGTPVIGDVSIVDEQVNGTCGHYMGNDVSPDGRAYLSVHASPGACLGADLYFVPFTHSPWWVYIQDDGPTV